MRKINRIILVLLLSWLATPVSLVSQETSGTVRSFIVEVESWVLVPGECLKYTVTPKELVVAYQNDYGVELHEVFRKTLEAPEAERIHVFLGRLPLDSFDSAYIDTSIDDGFKLTFEFQVGGKPKKKVILQNQWQVDLAKLCREINRLVPDKYALNVPPEHGTGSGRGPN